MVSYFLRCHRILQIMICQIGVSRLQAFCAKINNEIHVEISSLCNVLILAERPGVLHCTLVMFTLVSILTPKIQYNTHTIVCMFQQTHRGQTCGHSLAAAGSCRSPWYYHAKKSHRIVPWLFQNLDWTSSSAGIIAAQSFIVTRNVRRSPFTSCLLHIMRCVN